MDQMLTLIKTSIPLFVTVIAAVALVFLLLGILLGKALQKGAMHALIKKEREDAIKKSRAVLSGLTAEQMAPFMPDFPCNAGDVHFLGNPVDYIAFVGRSEGKPIRDIVFIEVKTGKSTLNQHEKEIKAAIKAGRVHFTEYRV